MSKRRMAVAVLAAALAGVGSIAVAQQPAAAEVRYIHDKANDGDDNGGGPNDIGDVKRVRIGHGKDWVYFKATPHRGAFLGDFDDYWIDTNLKNPGPEFVVQTNTTADSFQSPPPRVHKVSKATGYGISTATQEQRSGFRIPCASLRTGPGPLPRRLR